MDRKSLIEKEWKYFLEDINEIENIKRNSKKIGILQWYLKQDNDYEERVRLNLIPQKTGIQKIWIKTIKKSTKNSQERIEYEETFLPKDQVIKQLISAPVVIKTRYIYLEDPEIILDEYHEIEELIEYDIDKKYILEVEEKSKPVNFDNLKEYGIEHAQKLNEKEIELFKNQKIAKKIKKENLESLIELINFVENKLVGNITVVMPTGMGIIKNIEGFLKTGDENQSKEDIDSKIQKLIELTEKNPENLSKYSPEIETLDILVKKGFSIKKVILFLNHPYGSKDKVLNQKDHNNLIYIDKDIIKKLGMEHIEDEKVNMIYYYLKFFIKKIFGTNIEVEYRSLDFDPNDEQTSKNTFNEVWNYLDEIFAKEKEVIIDIAPGIKYIGVIMALYAMFNRKSFYYKYQFTPNLIKVPPFGIDWDYNYIDELNSIFNSYNSELSEEIINLPKELQEILNIKENQVISFYPIKKIIKNFKEKREMPFSYGERYLQLIENEELKIYIKEGIIKKWSQMWLGDQIPETVEHSQRHSKRLMEFTANLINIIGEEEFLSPFSNDELNREYIKGITYKDLIYFLLAVAINIHDLGHTYPIFARSDGKKFFLDSLPSLVRDLHHELTVQLIEDKNYDILAEKNKFETITITSIFKDKEKRKELIDAIKMICKYHRSYLGVDENLKSLSPSKQKFVEMMKLDTSLLKEAYNPQDKLLKKITLILAKWLKFIDGTDVQADRIVTESYHKNRLERTKHEILYLINKLGDNYNRKNDELRNEKIKIHEIIKNLKDKMEIKTEERFNEELRIIEENAELLEKYVYDNIENIDKEIEIIDKIAFKSKQFSHFNKHKSVSAIIPLYVKYNKTNPKKTLYLKLIENSEFSNLDKETIEKIKNEIIKEFENSKLSKDINIDKISFYEE